MPVYIELVENVLLSQPLSGDQCTFNLKLQHAGTGLSQRYLATYVSKELREALLGGQDREIHIVSVDPNSLASYLLPGRPLHVVTGVDLRDGRRLAGLPPAIKAWRRWGMFGTVVVCLIGAALAAQGYIWSGLLLVAGGSFFFRTFAALPGKSFWGHEDG